MVKYNELTKELRQLEQKRLQLQNKGEILLNCWIDSCAKTKGYRYDRLRTWKDGGSKLERVLKPEEVPAVKQAIARGREFGKVERRIQQVVSQIEQVARQAEMLGIPLKNSHGDRDASVEWYTPPEFIELARRVLGKIDLDPASNELAQSWIQAGHFYTKENNGLLQRWFGRVWCNPPYGAIETRLMARKFLERGIAAYQADEVEAGIFLLNRTGARWYRELKQQVTAICEVDRRITFIDSQGKRQGSPRYYNDFLYLGKNANPFQEVFQTIGEVRVLDPSV
jgi:hypothetical protein